MQYLLFFQGLDAHLAWTLGASNGMSLITIYILLTELAVILFAEFRSAAIQIQNRLVKSDIFKSNNLK
jgi:hypothetical protein